MKYPVEFKENLEYRARILEKAAGDPEMQAALVELCRKDRLFFFNTFLWTYDPRKEITKLPFITWSYQDEIIEWDALLPRTPRSDGRLGIDSLTEKSRDMGVTWTYAGNDVYDWLFIPQRIEILWGSRKADYVDKNGDMDSIFEKFRYIVDNLPVWLRPKGYKKNDHDNYMRLKNPETDSIIVGEATNNNFGRGGRKYRIRMDELGFWECDFSSWKSAASSTNCRSAISTPSELPVSKFAKLAQGTEEKIEKKTLHWTLHPEKAVGAYYHDGEGNQVPLHSPEKAFRAWQQRRGEKAPFGLKGGVVRSPWYDAECERRAEDDVAMELDINYAGSGSMFFSSRSLDAQAEWKPYERKGPTETIPYGKYITGDLVLVKNTEIRLMERSFGCFRFYELPKEGSQYVLSSDTAEGIEGGDYDAAYIRDKWTRNTIASLHGRWAPEDFAYKTWLLERFYAGALNAPENNNHGYTTALELEGLGSNLYYTRGENKKTKKKIHKRGFTTSGPTRRPMLDKMDADIRAGIELRDPDLLIEAHTFVRKKDGRPMAALDFNDDRILSWAIGGKVIDEYPYRPPKDKKKLRRAGKAMVKRKNAGFSFAKS